MSVTLESSTLRNPSPSSRFSLFSKRASMALCLSRPSPNSLQFESLFRPHRVSITAPAVWPRGLGTGLRPLHQQGFRNRSVFAFAAPHDELKPPEIEMEEEIETEEEIDLQGAADESQEAWKQTLASFKEQALKMRTVSQEAYNLYSKKAMVTLKETAEQLKIQAEKARYDISVIAKEISEEGKEYLSTAAENSPEPLKDIVETFATSTDDVKDISKVRDFYVGIPYGILLSFGGFLSFMLTGSTSAIRFGVILGGILLALSISSLRSWKRGETFPLALKGQAAIASILFLREIRVMFERCSLDSFFAALFSGAMVVFYLYRIRSDGGQRKSLDLD